jgi:hypothetical protein
VDAEARELDSRGFVAQAEAATAHAAELVDASSLTSTLQALAAHVASTPGPVERKELWGKLMAEVKAAAKNESTGRKFVAELRERVNQAVTLDVAEAQGSGLGAAEAHYSEFAIPLFRAHMRTAAHATVGTRWWAKARAASCRSTLPVTRP